LTPLGGEKVLALIEEKTKTYATEEKVKEVVEGAIAALKLAVPEEGEKRIAKNKR